MLLQCWFERCIVGKAQSQGYITIFCVLKARGFSKHGVHNFSEALDLHSNLSIGKLQDNMEVFSPFVLIVWMCIESFP